MIHLPIWLYVIYAVTSAVGILWLTNKFAHGMARVREWILRDLPTDDRGV